jgi:hypothetical protein
MQAEATSEKPDFATQVSLVDPTCRLRRYTSTDDQESETARSVYCPGRNGLLYSRRSTPASPFGVDEDRARVFRSNPYPLHGRAGLRP